MTKLLHLWDDPRSSLWFVPALIVLGAVVLAVGVIEFDTTAEYGQWMQRWPRVFGVGASGARGMLAAIASSMVTVAGVTFSITVVALALASSQYTSRILRNFMRNRTNQTVLGVFIGVFAYCLVVLRTIRGGERWIGCFRTRSASKPTSSTSPPRIWRRLRGLRLHRERPATFRASMRTRCSSWRARSAR